MNFKLASFTCLYKKNWDLLCNFVSINMSVYYQFTGRPPLVQYVRQHWQFHRKQKDISWTHQCSCVLNTGYFKFNKGPTAFWQILSRHIMYKVLPRYPNRDPLLEEFCYHNDAPFKKIPKFNTGTFKRLFLFHCWYSMNTHAREKNELFLSNPYLIM